MVSVFVGFMLWWVMGNCYVLELEFVIGFGYVVVFLFVVIEKSVKRFR